MTTSDSSSLPPAEFPAAPRVVPPEVRGAATFEPRVRFWMIVAVLLVGIALYLGYSEFSKWSEDRSLILSGTPVDSTVVEAAKTDIKGRRQPWNDVVKLKFTTAAGAEQVVEGFLREKPGGSEIVVVGQPLPIRYDPQNPARWTDRKSVPSIADALISVYLLVPVAMLALAAAVWQRSRVLATYVNGVFTPAAVLSVASTPLAPGYAKVTAATSAERGRELANVTVYLPKSRPVAKGDVIYLLLPLKSGVPLAVDAF